MVDRRRDDNIYPRAKELSPQQLAGKLGSITRRTGEYWRDWYNRFQAGEFESSLRARRDAGYCVIGLDEFSSHRRRKGKQAA